MDEPSGTNPNTGEPMDMSPPQQAARKRSLCSPAHSETGGQERPMEMEEAELTTPPPILREPQRSTKIPQKDPPKEREAHNTPPLHQKPRQTDSTTARHNNRDHSQSAKGKVHQPGAPLGTGTTKAQQRPGNLNHGVSEDSHKPHAKSTPTVHWRRKGPSTHGHPWPASGCGCSQDCPSQSKGSPVSHANSGTNAKLQVDETELWQRAESWPTFLPLDKTKPATRKWDQARKTGKFHPLPECEMNLADKLSALKSVIATMSQQQAFLEACGVDTKAPNFDLTKAIREFEMHHIPHTMVALIVSEAFEGGNHFNGGSFFPDRKSKSKACQFMVNLAMTAFDLSAHYNSDLEGWKNPSFRDALHHALSEYFGPVALSFNAPPKPPNAAKKPPPVRVNPYISKKNRCQNNRQSSDSGDCGGPDTHPLPSDPGARPTPTKGLGGNSL